MKARKAVSGTFSNSRASGAGTAHPWKPDATFLSPAPQGFRLPENMRRRPQPRLRRPHRQPPEPDQADSCDELRGRDDCSARDC